MKTANLGPKEVDLQTTLLYLYFCKSEIIVWWETIALSQQTAVSDGLPVTTFDRFWKIIVVNKFEDDKALGNHQMLWIELLSIRDMF